MSKPTKYPPSRLVKDHREVKKILRSNGIEWTNCDGSHRKAPLPNGEVLLFHDHEGDQYSKGIATVITKALRRAGLIIFFLLSLYEISLIIQLVQEVM